MAKIQGNLISKIFKISCSLLLVSAIIQLFLVPIVICKVVQPKSVTSSANGTILKYHFDIESKCSFLAGGTNEELSKCITTLRDEIRPRMGVGVPEIGFKPLEPIHLKTFSFNEGRENGPIVINTKFNNLNMWGLTSYTKWIISIDRAAKTWTYDMEVARMQLEGNYEMTGKVFVFPLGGNGTFYFNLRDFSLAGTNKINVKTNEAGQKYLVASKSPIRMDIKNIQIHLNNLFNGNQILGPAINNFLNENVQEIFQEIKPNLEEQVGAVAVYVINGLLGGVSPLAKYFEENSTSSNSSNSEITNAISNLTMASIINLGSKPQLLLR